MFCKQCGAELEEGDLFCSECGTKVEQVVDTPKTEVITPEVIPAEDYDDDATVFMGAVPIASEPIAAQEKAIAQEEEIASKPAETPAMIPTATTNISYPASTPDSGRAGNDATTEVPGIMQACGIFLMVLGALEFFAYFFRMIISGVSTVGALSSILYYGPGEFIGSMMVTIILLITALCFAVTGVAGYTIFRAWVSDKAKNYMIVTCAVSIVLVLVMMLQGILRLIMLGEFVLWGGVNPLIAFLMALLPAMCYMIMSFAAGVNPFTGFDTSSIKADAQVAIADMMAAMAFVTDKFEFSELGKKVAVEDTQTDGTGARKLKTNRSLLLYILLGIITFGIYDWWIIYTVLRDVRIACDGDGQHTPGFLLFLIFSILTCGIYALYTYYKVGNRLQLNGSRYGVTIVESGTSILLWRLFGFLLCFVGSFIGMHILLKNTNIICHAYNREHGFVQ